MGDQIRSGRTLCGVGNIIRSQGDTASNDESESGAAGNPTEADRAE